jgi:hypothetical protein
MTNERAGPIALIIGAILSILVFAFHPSHVVEQPVLGPFTLSQLVHGTALLGVPLLLYGLWQLGEWLGLDRAAARMAVVLSLLAATATINAAVISNFVTPAAAKYSMMSHAAPPHGAPPHAAPAGHGTTPRMILPPLVSVAVATNRGFAQVHVAFLSLAVLLFGLAIRPRNSLLGWAGVAVGAAPVMWQLSGQFAPSTHTMPLIIFPQALWMIAAGAVMLRHRSD